MTVGAAQPAPDRATKCPLVGSSTTSTTDELLRDDIAVFALTVPRPAPAHPAVTHIVSAAGLTQGVRPDEGPSTVAVLYMDGDKRMAQRVQVILTDDLNGYPAAETVSFALDGTAYEIDLSAKNAIKLRKALEPFVAAARGTRATDRVTISDSRGPATRSVFPVSSRAVRAWAKSHHIEVSPRGRIPADVVERFRQAGN